MKFSNFHAAFLATFFTAANAHAGPLLRMDPPCGWCMHGAVIDFDFEHGRYFGSTLADLSITRASSGYAQTKSGLLVSFGNNVLRLTDQGLIIEDAATNSALWSRDWTQTGTNNWTATNVIAAKTAIGADGAANSATRLAATAANGTVLQNTTLATSSLRYFSVFIQRVVGTGTISITQDGGATWTDVASQLSASMYVRVQQSQTLTTPIIGIRLGTSGDVVNVDFAQLEDQGPNTLHFASSPILTVGAVATRAADVITVGNGTPTYAAAARTPGSVFIKSFGCLSDVATFVRFSGGFVVRGNQVSFPQSIDNTTLSAAVGSGTYVLTAKTVATYDGATGSIVGNNGSVVSGAQLRSLNSGTLYIGNNVVQNRGMDGYLQRLTFFPNVLPGYGSLLTMLP